MQENKRQPLVSVITALYNSEKYIAATIDSVLNQTYTNWEMIIVDDKSTDNSVEIVKQKALQDERVKLLQLDKNHGMPFAARNRATLEAKGQFIACLDSDDLWANDKLEKQIHFMLANDYPISFTAYSKMYEADLSKKKIISVPEVVTYRDLLKTNEIGNLTSMYSVNKVGKLLQIGHLYEDYIMWLQTLEKGFKAYGINEILAYYRVHDKGYSADKFKMAMVTWKIYRKIMRIDVMRSSWYFFNYAWNGLKKK